MQDRDRTKALIGDLGVTTTVDEDLQPGLRWVELACGDGAGATLSLVSGRGVEVGELLDWESTPLTVNLLDHDGNRFSVSEEG